MALPFAAIEDRTARAVLRHVANAQATATTRFGEVMQFAVIFDNGYEGALGDLMAGGQPQARARTADVQDLDVGCPFSIGCDDYRVAAPLQADGTGISLILLERVV